MQSKEFREILMTKMRKFDFENGSTAETACLSFSKQIFVFLLSAHSCVVFNQLSRDVQEKAI